jgi:hypothetical protein
VEAHEVCVRLFSKRIGSNGPARVLDRPLQVARLLRQKDELAQCLQTPLRQPGLLRQNPLIIVSGQKRAPIQSYRLAKSLLSRPGLGRLNGILQRCLELRHVRCHCLWV